jgi:hypothetical protein
MRATDGSRRDTDGRKDTASSARRQHTAGNRLKPAVSVYVVFIIQQFYIMPTQCIYVLCVALRANSDYFPIQH